MKNDCDIVCASPGSTAHTVCVFRFVLVLATGYVWSSIGKNYCKVYYGWKLFEKMENL